MFSDLAKFAELKKNFSELATVYTVTVPTTYTVTVPDPVVYYYATPYEVAYAPPIGLPYAYSDSSVYILG